MHGDRADPERRQPLAEGRQLGRRLRPPLPGGRVVDEDLERVGADRVGALDGPDHPGAEREVRAQRPAVGKGGTRHGRRDQRLAQASCRFAPRPGVYDPAMIGSMSPKSPSRRR